MHLYYIIYSHSATGYRSPGWNILIQVFRVYADRLHFVDCGNLKPAFHSGLHIAVCEMTLLLVFNPPMVMGIAPRRPLGLAGFLMPDPSSLRPQLAGQQP